MSPSIILTSPLLLTLLPFGSFSAHQDIIPHKLKRQSSTPAMSLTGEGYKINIDKAMLTSQDKISAWAPSLIPLPTLKIPEKAPTLRISLSTSKWFRSLSGWYVELSTLQCTSELSISNNFLAKQTPALYHALNVCRVVYWRRRWGWHWDYSRSSKPVSTWHQRARIRRRSFAPNPRVTIQLYSSLRL